MKTFNNYDKLLQFMYTEYNKQRHGKRVHVLVLHFERQSIENRIGNANDKKAAVAYLHKNGWIEIVNNHGEKITDSTEAYSIGMMEPTQKGREYLRQKRIDIADAIASVSGTFLGKLFRK